MELTILVTEDSVRTIPLGYSTENSVTNICFDLMPWIQEVGPGGSASILLQRPIESEAAPVLTTLSDYGIASHALTSGDLQYTGTGKCQVVYTVNGKVKKSRIYNTVIMKSLSDSGTVPDPWQSWVDRVLEVSGDAEEAVKHYPYIDEDTNHWFAWNVDNKAWYDTGVSAEGTAGQGVPVGGTAGQVLAKVDATNYNTHWVDAAMAMPTITLAETQIISQSPIVCQFTDAQVAYLIDPTIASIALDATAANMGHLVLTRNSGVVAGGSIYFYIHDYYNNTSIAHYRVVYNVALKQGTFNYTASATTAALDNHTNNENIHVTAAEKTSWTNKQSELVSGTNIKTIDNQSVLGSGNLAILPSGGTTGQVLAKTDGTDYNVQWITSSGGMTIPLITIAASQETEEGIQFTTEQATIIENESYHLIAMDIPGDGTTNRFVFAKTAMYAGSSIVKLLLDSSLTMAESASDIDSYVVNITYDLDTKLGIFGQLRSVTATEKTYWNNKQAALVSGTNIKTIDGSSVLGSGNLSILPSGGTAGQVLSKIDGTDYNVQWITSSGGATYPVITVSDSQISEGIIQFTDEQAAIIENSAYQIIAISLPVDYGFATFSGYIAFSKDVLIYGSEMNITALNAMLGWTPADYPDVYNLSITYLPDSKAGYYKMFQCAKYDRLETHISSSDIHVTADQKTSWTGKQDALVSGTNIKTVNGTSLLGTGNIPAIPTGGTTGQVLSKVDGTDYNTQWVTVGGSSLPMITVASSQKTGNSIQFTDEQATIIENSSYNLIVIELPSNYGTYRYVFNKTTMYTDSTISYLLLESVYGMSFNSGGTMAIAVNLAYNLSTKIGIYGDMECANAEALSSHTSNTDIHVTSADKTTWTNKQDALVSGTNVKTINGTSVLGSGNIAAIPTGGTAGQVLSKIDGTDYNVQWSDGSSSFSYPVITIGESQWDYDTSKITFNDAQAAIISNSQNDIIGINLSVVDHDDLGLNFGIFTRQTTSNDLIHLASMNNWNSSCDSIVDIVYTSATKIGSLYVNVFADYYEVDDHIYNSECHIEEEEREEWNGKQDALVSGTNIKTINNLSLLGSGDLSVQAALISGTNIKTINGMSILGSGNLPISGTSGNIPAGGTVGQVLAKVDGTDYNTHWIDPSDGSTMAPTITVASSQITSYDPMEIQFTAEQYAILSNVNTVLVKLLIPEEWGSNPEIFTKNSLSGDYLIFSSEYVRPSSRVSNVSASSLIILTDSYEGRIKTIAVPSVSASTTGTSTTEIKYITINGVEYKLPEGGSGGDAEWGSITGEIEDQDDLQEVLDEKANIYISSTEPTDAPDGTIWVDTNPTGTTELATKTWVNEQDFASVSASATGTSSTVIKYITIDDTTYKLPVTQIIDYTADAATAFNAVQTAVNAGLPVQVKYIDTSSNESNIFNLSYYTSTKFMFTQVYYGESMKYGKLGLQYVDDTYSWIPVQYLQ